MIGVPEVKLKNPLHNNRKRKEKEKEEKKKDRLGQEQDILRKQQVIFK